MILSVMDTFISKVIGNKIVKQSIYQNFIVENYISIPEVHQSQHVEGLNPFIKEFVVYFLNRI
jgi:hypothetical protein